MFNKIISLLAIAAFSITFGAGCARKCDTFDEAKCKANAKCEWKAAEADKPAHCVELPKELKK